MYSVIENVTWHLYLTAVAMGFLVSVGHGLVVCPLSFSLESKKTCCKLHGGVSQVLGSLIRSVVPCSLLSTEPSCWKEVLLHVPQELSGITRAFLLHGQGLWVLSNRVVHDSGCILVNDCNLARIVQAGWTGAGKIGFLFLWGRSRIGAVLAAPLWKVWVLPSFYVSAEILSGLSTVELDTYTGEPSILPAWASVDWSLDLWIPVH